MSRILIVDDNSLVRDALRLMLTRAGHEVVEASDGGRALALHKESPAEMIVTDILMPKVEGLETIREFRRLMPECKIIAITGGGYLDPETMLSLAKEAGADAIFTKPIEREAFLAGLAALGATA